MVAGLGRRSVALVLALLLACSVVLLDTPVAAEAQSAQSELNQAKAERDRLQAELAAAVGDVTEERGQLLAIRDRLEDALGRLRLAEGQLALAENALATAQERIEVAEQELTIATRLLADAEAELEQSQDEFAEQVVTAYKYGAAARGEMLVTMFESSTSPGDLAANLYRMGAVIDHQDSVVERIAALRDEQAAAREEAEDARRVAEESRAQAEVELAFVQQRREEAATFEALVAQEEAAQTQILSLASEGANDIARRLGEAEERVKKAEAEVRRQQAAARGGVLCPIDPVWFSNDWGYPRSGGRRHQGNDLFADEGTPIVAIADGVIRRLDATDTYVPGSNRGDLGGISISYWVDADEYWYFAHLQKLAPGLSTGDAITAGQLVGWVGRTGNAYNTPPHSHVGRYVNGSPVNPFPTLGPACN